MPTLESGLAAIATKFGWIKLATLGAAVGGAAIMAMFRPPKTRKEVAAHAFVALASSLIFGNSVYAIAQNYVPLDMVAVHGLIGALSWGAWAGLASWRDKFAENPTQAIKEIKDVV